MTKLYLVWVSTVCGDIFTYAVMAKSVAHAKEVVCDAYYGLRGDVSLYCGVEERSIVGMRVRRCSYNVQWVDRATVHTAEPWKTGRLPNQETRKVRRLKRFGRL